MPEALRFAITCALLAIVLILVMVRPRGLSEAWWTFGGAALAMVLHLLAPRDYLDAVVKTGDVLLFLLALLLMSALLEAGGFFDWAAIRAAEMANGDPWNLFKNMFVLGAAITAAMSLDTTAVILTPVVVSAVQRLRLKPSVTAGSARASAGNPSADENHLPVLPYVLLCAFISNFASLLLPVSNLTNLLYASALHMSFARYTLLMALPQAAALAAMYAVMRQVYRRQLRQPFDPEALPHADTMIRNAAYFRVCRFVLTGVLVLYFVAPAFHWEPYMVGFAGCGCLLISGFRSGALRFDVFRHVSWSVFPFVIGLFGLVRALEGCAIFRSAVGTVAGSLGSNGIAAPFAACGMSALLSNIINNLPAGLLSIGVLTQAHAPFAVAGGSLIGANIGPGFTTIGSLATLLVVEAARKRGEHVGARDIFRLGVLVTPCAAIAAVVTLVLESALLRNIP